MRYIADKTSDGYVVSGIKAMKDLKGKEVEVVFATKQYDKEQLKQVMEGYKQEFELKTEQYNNDIKDMEAILEAINLSN